MTRQKLKIVYRSPSDLIPYVNNARTHSDEQIQQIAKSIDEFGFNAPILVDGENGIIAGHGRYEAALSLGLDGVPTIDLSHLTDSQKRAYIIADNKLALNSGWDIETLGDELDSLMADDVDLALLGFSTDDLQRIADDRDLAAIRNMADDGGEDEDEAARELTSEPSTEPKSELFPLSLMLEHDQREVVFKALKKAKQEHEFENSSQAIWFICKGYIHE
jgi:ParB-like chromosome segregation protein Spo0J